MSKDIYANSESDNTADTNPKTRSLPPHPKAKLFPLLHGIELEVLAEDIKHNGLLFPIIIHQGQILDGRNRYAACEIAGVEPRFEELASCIDPFEFVISANVHRRQLSGQDRRKLIKTILAWKPELSNRQIAKMVEADKNTVGSVRLKLESSGEIHQLVKTVGADGRKRSTKPQRPTSNAKPLRKLTDEEIAKELIADVGTRDAGMVARKLSGLDLAGNSWDRIVDYIRRPEPTSEGLPLDDNDEPPTMPPPGPTPSRWS